MIGVILLMAGMILTGCESPEVSKETSTFDLPIRLVLPANETSFLSRAQAPMNAPAYNEAGAPAREMSDPGSKEEFEVPVYIYIFVAFAQNNLDTIIATSISTGLTTSDWEPLSINGDSCYVYTQRVEIPETPVFGSRKSARVYAAASSVPLTLKYVNASKVNTTIDVEDDDTWPSEGEREQEIKNMKFTVNAALQPKLQHIYSTPCTYWVDGQYYGTVKNIQNNAPRLDLVLYHVAAKVDLMWNVPDTSRTKMRVAGIAVKNLFNEDAYLFKHVGNTKAAMITSGGYTPTDSLSTDLPGNWWAGRTYFYTIPYLVNDSFPLQLDVKSKKPDNSNVIKQLTIKQRVQTADSVFAPWIRGQFNFTKPLTDNTIVKI